VAQRDIETGGEQVVVDRSQASWTLRMELPQIVLLAVVV
jgi:hypothetical protein